jgi:hypothetical protein
VKHQSLKTALSAAMGVNAPRIHRPGGELVLKDQFIGVEMEVENYTEHVAEQMLPLGWSHHQDGSLRNGAEWVFRDPTCGQEVVDRLHAFERVAEEQNWAASFRTSTHVHIGFSQDTPYEDIPEDTLERVQNFLCVYYVLEEGFFAYAAGDRKACGYCDPFSAAPEDFIGVVTAPTLSDFTAAVRGSARYYGCNPAALSKYGTIEFRALPLHLKARPVLDWINIILRMKKWAYLSVGEDVVASIREAGRDGLLDSVFDKHREIAAAAVTQADFDKRLAFLEAINAGRNDAVWSEERDRRELKLGNNPIIKRYMTMKAQPKVNADEVRLAEQRAAKRAAAQANLDRRIREAAAINNRAQRVNGANRLGGQAEFNRPLRGFADVGINPFDDLNNPQPAVMERR